MTYEDLLARIIADGIAEVRVTYADPKDHHKRDGAIEGFEACRDKSPSELVVLWTEEERKQTGAFRDTSDIQGYWRQRFKTLQIEWVCNVVSVGLTTSGQPPLIGHLPTARGAMKYAEVVGVRGHGDAS